MRRFIFRLMIQAVVLLIGGLSCVGQEPSGPWKPVPCRFLASKPVNKDPSVAPASYQSPVAPAEPFPLPAGIPTPDELFRQTDADVLRKSYGCVNCHQGVR